MRDLRRNGLRRPITALYTTLFIVSSSGIVIQPQRPAVVCPPRGRGIQVLRYDGAATERDCRLGPLTLARVFDRDALATKASRDQGPGPAMSKNSVTISWAYS